MNIRIASLTFFLPTSLLTGFADAAPAPAGLKVSGDHRFLVTNDNKPFFWLGDTAWELFHRLDRGAADRYLETRAKQGFTVIQAVALAELDGLNKPSAYGHLPLQERDPARPAVIDGPSNDYWDHVDYIVDKANRLGLTIGFLPTWGDKWFGPAEARIFDVQNAAVYGEWLGQRYRDKSLVWILGGDRLVENDGHRAILQAMAEGLKKGDGGSHLITFHAVGNKGSSEYFHETPWLDFNTRQNGHGTEYNGRYDQLRVDYERSPFKPVIDIEPIYEDHPIAFDAVRFGHSTAADVRRPLYWNLFSGACGHTYGHHSVWQMASGQDDGVNRPLMTWSEALDQAGAAQMQYGRWLMMSRPFGQFVPDQEVIVPDKWTTSVPGAGRYYFAATRASDGSCAMVYVPIARKFKVRMDKIAGPSVKAWWFNPRDGKAHEIGRFPNTGEQEFLSPDPGEGLDWVLVLDDAAKALPAPGQRL